MSIVMSMWTIVSFWFLSIGVLLSLLAIAGFLQKMSNVAKPRRAKTCGTCSYCTISPVAKALGDGRCCRRPHIGEPRLVRLDWPGCGDSEQS